MGGKGGPRRMTPDEVRAVFKRLDADTSGEIDLKEWTDAGLPEEEFHRYDADKSGTLTLDELSEGFAKDLLNMTTGAANAAPSAALKFGNATLVDGGLAALQGTFKAVTGGKKGDSPREMTPDEVRAVFEKLDGVHSGE